MNIPKKDEGVGTNSKTQVLILTLFQECEEGTIEVKEKEIDPDEPKPGILPKIFDFLKFAGLTLVFFLFFSHLGPGVLISVGYIDPGNWATDIEGGSVYEYKLIWVLFFSNAIAILLQTLSGKFLISFFLKILLKSEVCSI